MTQCLMKMTTMAEETANCVGEPCTDDEKEDSWLDDETEY